MTDPTTNDGVRIKVGMRLSNQDGGPTAVVEAVVDGGLCLTVRGPWRDRANWWVSKTWYDRDLMIERCWTEKGK